tara:strand:+ start:261 stop:764 length:504 start_codon:yes stop_codon:yes gene_type:complete
MTIIKDTERSLVKLDKDKGIIEKTFVGNNAKERFENEVNILKHLDNKGFDNCPKLLDSDPENFVVTQTYVGEKLGEIDIAEHRNIHNRLIAFGVTHNDSVINPDLFSPPIIDRLKTEKVETNKDGEYLVTYTAVTPNPQIINAPKNLVVDANGQINVIDFERAVLDE